MAKKKRAVKTAGKAPRWSVRGLALSCGILWALAMLFMGLMGLYYGYGLEFLKVMESVYVGFELSLMGVVIGTVWGFIDGIVGGAIFAWVYNKLR